MAAAAFAWSGAFSHTRDGLPLIGRVAGFSHLHAAYGYGGNGITFSMMAAQILRGHICGDGDTDADLFSFTRRF